MAKPKTEDRTPLRARRLVGVLGAGLGNGLGLALWWQAGQYVLHVGRDGLLYFPSRLYVVFQRVFADLCIALQLWLDVGDSAGPGVMYDVFIHAGR